MFCVFMCVGLCFVTLPFFYRLALLLLRTEKAVLDTKQRFSRISVELSVTQLNSVTRVKSSIKFVSLGYLFVGNLLTCVNIGYVVSTSFCVIFECIWCQTWLKSRISPDLAICNICFLSSSFKLHICVDNLLSQVALEKCILFPLLSTPKTLKYLWLEYIMNQRKQHQYHIYVYTVTHYLLPYL